MGLCELPSMEVKPLINDKQFAVEMPCLLPFSLTGWELCSEQLASLPSIQTETLAKLLAVDLVVGNADRSTSNLLVRSQGSQVDLFPIDHNLALIGSVIPCEDPAYIGFIEHFNGLSTSSFNKYKNWFWSRCGTIEQIIYSTPVYYRFTHLQLSNRSSDILLQACKFLCKNLTYHWIETEVDSLPNNIFLGSLSERKTELKRVLHSRTKKLVSAMQHYIGGSTVV
jgi:hypothetical protein